MAVPFGFDFGSTATEAANRVRRPETSQESARQSLESAIKDSPAGEPITITG